MSESGLHLNSVRSCEFHCISIGKVLRKAGMLRWQSREPRWWTRGGGQSGKRRSGESVTWQSKGQREQLERV